MTDTEKQAAAANAFARAVTMIGPPNADGCREWQGPVYRNQTPSLTIKGYQFTIPRLIYDVWRASQGLDPVPDGIKVTKRDCRNRMCCNPEHMGTAVLLPGDVDEWKSVILAAGDLPLLAQLETAITIPNEGAGSYEDHWTWKGPRQGTKPVWYTYDSNGRRSTVDAARAYYALLGLEEGITDTHVIRRTCGQPDCMKPLHMKAAAPAEDSQAKTQSEAENRAVIQAALARKAKDEQARQAAEEAERARHHAILEEFMNQQGGTYTPAETNLASAVSANEAHMTYVTSDSEAPGSTNGP